MEISPFTPGSLPATGPLTESDLQRIEGELRALGQAWVARESVGLALVVEPDGAPVFTAQPPPSAGKVSPVDIARIGRNVSFAVNAAGYIQRLVNEVRMLRNQLPPTNTR